MAGDHRPRRLGPREGRRQCSQPVPAQRPFAARMRDRGSMSIRRRQSIGAGTGGRRPRHATQPGTRRAAVTAGVASRRLRSRERTARANRSEPRLVSPRPWHQPRDSPGTTRCSCDARPCRPCRAHGSATRLSWHVRRAVRVARARDRAARSCPSRSGGRPLPRARAGMAQTADAAAPRLLIVSHSPNAERSPLLRRERARHPHLGQREHSRGLSQSVNASHSWTIDAWSHHRTSQL